VSDPQPEGKVSDPQPETALTTLIGGNDTLKEVNSESELTNAIADSTVGTVKLAGDISISSSLTVNRTVTLDLNGKVLQMTGSGSVIKVESSGNLTLTDSNTTAKHPRERSRSFSGWQHSPGSLSGACAPAGFLLSPL
jgi:hypothetical protein